MPITNSQQDINLIPQEVVKEKQFKSNQSKLVTYAVGILALALVGVGISFYFVTTSKGKLESLKRAFTEKSDQIKSLETLEKNAQITQGRLSYISNVFKDRVYYSTILKEMEKKSIPQILVSGVNISSSFVVTIQGTASSTLYMQTYVNDLVKGEPALFSDAKIKTLEVSEGTGNTKFTIEVTAKKELLTKDE